MMKHPSASQAEEDRTVLDIHSAAIALTVFIAVFCAGLALHYMH